MLIKFKHDSGKYHLFKTATHRILHLTDPYSLLSGAAQYFSHKADPMID
jgi:hypothetical protein